MNQSKNSYNIYENESTAQFFKQKSMETTVDANDAVAYLKQI